MKTKISTMLLGALLGAGLLASCSKEQPAGENQEMLNNAEAQVSFVPQIESGAEVSEVQSKAVATAPLAVGTKVNIMVARKNGNDDYLNPLTIENLYANKMFSVGSSTLVPSDGNEFSMFKDTYTFIAVSDNTTANQTLVWSNVSSGLHTECRAGGVDYIGVILKDQSIASNTKLSLSFKRLCAKIQVTVSKDDATIKTMQVTGATISNGTRGPKKETALLTVTGTSMSLLPFPLIGTSTYPMEKGSTDNEYSYILAPIGWDSTESQKLPVTITATVTPVGAAGISYTKDYILNITKAMVPAIEAGKIYKFTAKISASGITFDGIPQVNDWPAADGEITLDPSEN